MTRKRVVFLMSDTGNGHRSAANAIRTALDTRFPDEFTVELVDVFRRYTPFPFNCLPELYPRWIRWSPRTWAAGYRWTDTPQRARWMMSALNALWRPGLRRMIAEHPADVYVSVHALFSRPVMQILARQAAIQPRLVTVITDLVTAHAFWYEKQADRCLVPTWAAYDRAGLYDLQPQQVHMTGMPIDPRFSDALLEKHAARARLQLDACLPAVLLIGGGAGMGPVYHTALALNQRRLEHQLIVVAGRNEDLRRRLAAIHWNQPTLIYPFVNNMPELMSAADILVTKAGPATICEACIAGLPIIVSSAVPGQEDGNVRFVVENGIGEYAPGPERAADAVARWLAEGPARLSQRAQRAHCLGRPSAVWAIADEIHSQAQERAAPPYPPCECADGQALPYIPGDGLAF